MKHLAATLLFSLIVSAASAQSPLQWGLAAQSTGNVYEDAFSVTFDTQHNLYVTGYFSSSSVTFGNFTLYNSGQTDAFIVKYDPLLNPLWAISFGGASEEYGMGITCDSSNRIVVVGNYTSPYIVLGNDTLYNSGSSTPDMFIARLDVNGDFVWARSEGCINWDNCAAVDMNTANGDIYVGGAFYLDDMIIGNDTFVNAGGYDMVLMKFDINGNYQWAQHAGGNFNDLSNAVAYDAAGDFVVTSGGFASDTLNYPTDTLLNPAGGLPETFVVKYDANGTCIWARRSGAGDNDHSVGIDVDANGIIYVGGHYHSPGFAFGNDTLINQGQGDIYLLVYDGNGNQLWAKSAGGPEQDFGYNVFVDRLGNIYYSGMFASLTVSFGAYTHNNVNLNEDMFMTVYDAAGNETGSMSGGGLGMEHISSVVANTSGIYMVGSFGTPSLTLGSSTLTNTDPSGNTSDAFIATSSITLNTNSVAQPNTVQVMPNPGNGMFTFSSPEMITALTIYNAQGEVVSTAQNVNSMQQHVDLSAMPAGIYYYSIATESAPHLTGTFVKL